MLFAFLYIKDGIFAQGFDNGGIALALNGKVGDSVGNKKTIILAGKNGNRIAFIGVPVVYSSGAVSDGSLLRFLNSIDSLLNGRERGILCAGRIAACVVGINIQHIAQVIASQVFDRVGQGGDAAVLCGGRLGVGARFRSVRRAVGSSFVDSGGVCCIGCRAVRLTVGRHCRSRQHGRAHCQRTNGADNALCFVLHLVSSQ